MSFYVVEEERNRNIIALREQGLTLEAIGEKYGLTRERVRQIVAKYGKHIDPRIGQRRKVSDKACRNANEVLRTLYTAEARPLLGVIRSLGWRWAVTRVYENTCAWVNHASCVAAIQRCAKEHGTDYISTQQYAAWWANLQERAHVPSLVSISMKNRWLCWIEDAGLNVNGSKQTRGYKPKEPRKKMEAMTDFLVMCRTQNKTPSVHLYNRWSRENGKLGDTSIRRSKPFGQWLRQAAEELGWTTEQYQPPAQPVVQAPVTEAKP